MKLKKYAYITADEGKTRNGKPYSDWEIYIFPLQKQAKSIFMVYTTG